MKATGTISEPKGTDSVIFDPGTYNTRLVEMFLVAGTKYQSDEAQIEAVFRWELEADVAPIRDGFNKVSFRPGTAALEFQTERKYAGKFQQRLEALVGQMLTAEDAAHVDADIDTPDWIGNFDELLTHLQELDDQGKQRRAMVRSLKIGDRELIGAEALITVSITEKTKNGQKVEYQKIEGVTAMPKRNTARRQAAPAPAAAEAPQPGQPVLMDPPPAQQRRRATTEPDLPF